MVHRSSCSVTVVHAVPSPAEAPNGSSAPPFLLYNPPLRLGLRRLTRARRRGVTAGDEGATRAGLWSGFTRAARFLPDVARRAFPCEFPKTVRQVGQVGQRLDYIGDFSSAR